MSTKFTHLRRNRQPAFNPATPGPNQVGTLHEQFAAVEAYYGIDEVTRRADPAAAWESAMWQTMPHRRGVSGQEATP